MKIAYKITNTLKQKVANAKDKEDILQQNWVYKFKCYVGSHT